MKGGRITHLPEIHKSHTGRLREQSISDWREKNVAQRGCESQPVMLMLHWETMGKTDKFAVYKYEIKHFSALKCLITLSMMT